MDMAQDNENNQRLEPVFELIDSHCHLDFPIFDDSRESLINECALKGIKKFIVPGVTAATWPRLQNVSENYPSIYPAYGLHPYFIDEHKLEHVEELLLFLQSNNSIAVGEIGLDYYLKKLDKALQKKLFEAQLEVAKTINLPVILHVRKAHDDVLLLLKKYKVIGGTVHAFNGSLQQAHRYIDLGFKFGFGGALTFDNATHLRKLVFQLPLESILLETDSPDMSPAEYDKSYNTPLTALTVLSLICETRSENRVQISSQTTQNVKSLFSIID